MGAPRPVIGPLAAVGVGDAERYPGPGATALACLVVIVAVFLWWSRVTNLLAERVKGSCCASSAYATVAIVMCAKNAAFLAIAEGPVLWPAIVAEVVLAGLLLRPWVQPAVEPMHR